MIAIETRPDGSTLIRLAQARPCGGCGTLATGFIARAGVSLCIYCDPGPAEMPNGNP